MNANCPTPRPWGYAEALTALENATTFGVNPSLESITALCEALGNPQDSFASIQITGTNGKTSTARFTEAVLRAHGIRTALYTSPELQRYPERIEIGGAIVSDKDFALAVGVAADTALAVFGAKDPSAAVTEFELLTTAALWLFAQRGVEMAVLEVGMGGRWDATSVVTPVVATITGVGLDHAHILGDTVEKIAAEKAAIIRKGSTAVLGPGTVGLEDIFLDQARAVGADAVRVGVGDGAPAAGELQARFDVERLPDRPGGSLSLGVDGVFARYGGLAVVAPGYQAPNVATAVVSAEMALGSRLDSERTQAALVVCRIPGRFELVAANPPIVVDGAHNPQAAAVLAAAIEEAWPEPPTRPLVLLGVLSDKDAAGIVRPLAAVAGDIAVTASRSPRALAPDALAAIVEQITGRLPETFGSVPEALASLTKRHPGGVVVSGSLTMAGEARASLR